MKINIHTSTYIFLLLSFLSGYFEYMFLFLIIIFIHEFGHLFFGYLINLKDTSIIIYPFGGITKYNGYLNINTNKELFLLLGGIFFQIVFFMLIYFLYNQMYITTHVYLIIKRINILLISFNFMPILPLDGGKLLNIILDKMFSYRASNIISVCISLIFILLFLIKNTTYFAIILSIFLIKCIIVEVNSLNYKYSRFLFERYKNNYFFKKIKIIKNPNCFKRDYYHIIDNISERDYLHKLFDTKY